MTNGDGPGGNNIIGIRDVFESVAGLRGEVNAQGQRLTQEITAVQTEQAYMKGKIDGSVGMMKWLGPTGVVALVYGMLKASGVL